MKIKPQTFLAKILSIGAVAALASTAAASPWRLPGMMGHGFPKSAEVCFTHSFAFMSNACTGTQVLVLPVVTDTPQSAQRNYTFSIRVFGQVGPKDISCNAIRTDRFNSGLVAPSRAIGGVAEGFADLTLPGFVVQPTDAVQIECRVDPGAGVHSYGWGN